MSTANNVQLRRSVTLLNINLTLDALQNDLLESVWVSCIY